MPKKSPSNKTPAQSAAKSKAAKPKDQAGDGANHVDEARRAMLRAMLKAKSESEEAPAPPQAKRDAEKPPEARARVVGRKEAAGGSLSAPEAEAGKAPAKARPLTQKQMEKLRERLVAEWEVVTRSANYLDAEIFESGRSSDAKSYGAHIAESASIGSALEIARAQSRIEGQILIGIQRALQRMQDKSYGQCERCGDPIGYARLSAKPWAGYCMNCKRELEKDSS